jgi:hypothetical protein
MAKIKMFIALLGMAIAGPLMFTGKKKLVNTGRDLMAVILVSFIEITVHSLMFDAIIYGTSIIISPSLFRLIITFFLLLLLWKFNAALNERIKSFTTGIENSVMSSGSIVKDAKRSMETALSRKPHELLAAKSAAYDAAHSDQAGGLKSKLLRMAADSTASASQKKGFTKITMESMKDQKKARAATAQEELENKENAVVYVENADCLQDAEYVAKEIKAKTNCKEVHVSTLGPIIGASCGPDTITVNFYGKKMDITGEE